MRSGRRSGPALVVSGRDEQPTPQAWCSDASAVAQCVERPEVPVRPTASMTKRRGRGSLTAWRYRPTRDATQDVGLQEPLSIWLLGCLCPELGRELEDTVARPQG